MLDKYLIDNEKGMEGGRGGREKIEQASKQSLTEVQKSELEFGRHGDDDECLKGENRRNIHIKTRTQL